MKRDFSPVAARRTAAIATLRHNGKRIEACLARNRLSRLQHIRAQDFHKQAAGHA